jgi:hypothetical protein
VKASEGFFLWRHSVFNLFNYKVFYCLPRNIHQHSALLSQWEDTYESEIQYDHVSGGVNPVIACRGYSADGLMR